MFSEDWKAGSTTNHDALSTCPGKHGVRLSSTFEVLQEDICLLNQEQGLPERKLAGPWKRLQIPDWGPSTRKLPLLSGNPLWYFRRVWMFVLAAKKIHTPPRF